MQHLGQGLLDMGAYLERRRQRWSRRKRKLRRREERQKQLQNQQQQQQQQGCDGPMEGAYDAANNEDGGGATMQPCGLPGVGEVDESVEHLELPQTQSSFSRGVGSAPADVKQQRARLIDAVAEAVSHDAGPRTQPFTQQPLRALDRPDGAAAMHFGAEASSGDDTRAITYSTHTITTANIELVEQAQSREKDSEHVGPCLNAESGVGAEGSDLENAVRQPGVAELQLRARIRRRKQRAERRAERAERRQLLAKGGGGEEEEEEEEEGEGGKNGMGNWGWGSVEDGDGSVVRSLTRSLQHHLVHGYSSVASGMSGLGSATSNTLNYLQQQQRQGRGRRKIGQGRSQGRGRHPRRRAGARPLRVWDERVHVEVVRRKKSFAGQLLPTDMVPKAFRVSIVAGAAYSLWCCIVHREEERMSSMNC